MDDTAGTSSRPTGSWFTRLRANYYNSHDNADALKTNIPDGRSELIIAGTGRIQWPTETVDTVQK